MMGKLPKMSTRELMIAISGRRPSHGERPRWLQKIADRLDIPERMARSLWDDEIKNQDHWAIKKLRREAELHEVRKEAAELARRYQILAGGMRATDENFYSAEIDRLERLARIIGGLDRT
jgi:hypothetical protein